MRGWYTHQGLSDMARLNWSTAREDQTTGRLNGPRPFRLSTAEPFPGARLGARLADALRNVMQTATAATRTASGGARASEQLHRTRR